MHRQLLVSGPEKIAAVAKDWETFERWQRENDFYDTENIKWYYIEKPYQTLGRWFNMVFLIEDWYKLKGAGKLITTLHKDQTCYIRTFTTEEMWRGKYRYRSTSLIP